MRPLLYEFITCEYINCFPDARIWGIWPTTQVNTDAPPERHCTPAYLMNGFFAMPASALPQHTTRTQENTQNNFLIYTEALDDNYPKCRILIFLWRGVIYQFFKLHYQFHSKFVALRNTELLPDTVDITNANSTVVTNLHFVQRLGAKRVLKVESESQIQWSYLFLKPFTLSDSRTYVQW